MCLLSRFRALPTCGESNTLRSCWCEGVAPHLWAPTATSTLVCRRGVTHSSSVASILSLWPNHTRPLPLCCCPLRSALQLTLQRSLYACFSTLQCGSCNMDSAGVQWLRNGAATAGWPGMWQEMNRGSGRQQCRGIQTDRPMIQAEGTGGKVRQGGRMQRDAVWGHSSSESLSDTSYSITFRLLNLGMGGRSSSLL